MSKKALNGCAAQDIDLMRQRRPPHLPIFDLSGGDADFAMQTFMGSPGRAVGRSLFAKANAQGSALPPHLIGSPLSRHVAEFDLNLQQQKQQQRGQNRVVVGSVPQGSPDTPRTRAFLSKIGGLSKAVDNARKWENNFAERKAQNAGRFAFEASVPRLPESRKARDHHEVWAHQKSQQLANNMAESLEQQHLREDAQFLAGRLGCKPVGRVDQLHKQTHSPGWRSQPKESDLRSGVELWGGGVSEGGKCRQTRLQADIDSIEGVVNLPDKPEHLLGHRLAVRKPHKALHEHNNAKGRPKKGSNKSGRRMQARNKGRHDKPLPSYMRSTAATRQWKEDTRKEKMKPKGQRNNIY